MAKRKESYVRDKRSPVPKSEAVSRLMSRNRARETGPEIILRHRLWASGIRGYRVNWRKVPGTPDIAFPGRNVAVFVNGCYWHHCRVCNYPLPKTNTEFWRTKFERNLKRDEEKTRILEESGWRVLTVWEHEIAENVDDVVRRIRRAIR